MAPPASTLSSAAGGVAVVQDPAEAEFASMPESALRHVEIDYVVGLDAMGPLLVGLVSPTPLSPTDVMAIPPDLKLEAAIAERVVGTTAQIEQFSHLVPLTCPGCGGLLWEMNAGHVLRYRCHTGHAYTAGALAASSLQSLEETLWVALRMMEERKNLLSNMANHADAQWNRPQLERVEEIKRHVNRLREFLLSSEESDSTVAAPAT